MHARLVASEESAFQEVERSYLHRRQELLSRGASLFDVVHCLNRGLVAFLQDLECSNSYRISIKGGDQSCPAFLRHID